MAARSRGLGISKEAMEASRLVFVYVRDSKPRRKVAIPVLDSYTWDQFCEQVKTKLKLTGISDIYLSANGHKVRSVSELQDIDELCVVEGPDAAMANGNSAFAPAAAGSVQRNAAELDTSGLEQPAAAAMTSPVLRQQSVAQDRHKIVVSSDGLGHARSTSYASDEESHKYARRAHPLKRTLQRIFPSLFAPGLPITTRDAQSDASDMGRAASIRRRRSKKSPYDVKNLLLVLATMSCVFTMLYLFIRVSTSPAVASMQQAGPSNAAQGLAEAAGAAGADVAAGLRSGAKAAAQQAAQAAAGVAGGGGAAVANGAPIGTAAVP